MRIYHFLRLVLPVMSLTLLLGAVNCSKDDNPTSSQTVVRPAPPSQPSPADNATEQPMAMILNWTGNHPEGDSLTYDLYFGTVEKPPLVASKLTEATFQTETLSPNKTYYWRVVAKDTEGHVGNSPTWKFTTVTSVVFPLAIGNNWSYQGVVYAIDIDLDARAREALQYLLDTVSLTITEHVASHEKLKGSIPCYQLVQTLYMMGPFTEPFAKYEIFVNNSGDGYYEYAYRAVYGKATESLPFVEGPVGRRSTISGTGSRQFNLVTATTNPADTMIYFDPPLKDLEYPLVVGSRWTVGEDSELRIDRYLSDSLQVEVSAGTFGVYQINQLYDFGNDGYWEDVGSEVMLLSCDGYVGWNYLLLYEAIERIDDTLYVSHGTYWYGEAFELVSYSMQ